MGFTSGVRRDDCGQTQLRALNTHITKSKKCWFWKEFRTRPRLYEWSLLVHWGIISWPSQSWKFFITQTISSHIEALFPLEYPKLLMLSMTVVLTTNPNSQEWFPEIKLPGFTVERNTWMTFINLFDSWFTKNTALSDIMQFKYQLSILSGEPLNLIRSLNLTEDNYTIVNNFLKECYHKNRWLSLLHLQKTNIKEPRSSWCCIYAHSLLNSLGHELE